MNRNFGKRDKVKTRINKLERGKMSDEEIKYAYWIYCVNGIGKTKIFKLYNKYHHYKTIYLLSEEQLEIDLGKKDTAAIINSKQKWDVQRKYEMLKAKGISFVPFSDMNYPEKLKNIPDPPFALFVRGRFPDANKKTVAVIGARICSEYGRYVARKLGELLAECQIQVISGMAMGVDGICQRGAIRAGGNVFAVLGNGVNVCYPSENRDVFEAIPKNGGVISEYQPDAEPKAFYFPPRNRIISGLADIVVVVEAKEKSGTLITVDMALEQGKEVWIVPGRITDPLSKGCNKLLRQGAEILYDMNEFVGQLDYVNKKNMLQSKECEEVKGEVIKSFEKDEIIMRIHTKIVLDNVDLYPKSIQEIYEIVSRVKDINISEVMMELVLLESENKIIGEGNYYCKSV